MQFLPNLTVTTSGGFTYGKVVLNPATGQRPRTVRRLRQQEVGRHCPATSTNKTGVATLKWDTVKGHTYQVRAYAASTSTLLGNYSAVKAIKSS